MNFGISTTIWDRLLGTFQPTHEPATDYVFWSTIRSYWHAAAFAVVVDLALPTARDRALLRLLFGRVRDDDPADILLAFVDALNKEAVV